MIVDPITNLVSGSSDKEVYSMLVRLIDLLKSRRNYRGFCEPHGRWRGSGKDQRWEFRL